MIVLVPEEGIEPSRDYSQGILIPLVSLFKNSGLHHMPILNNKTRWDLRAAQITSECSVVLAIVGVC